MAPRILNVSSQHWSSCSKLIALIFHFSLALGLCQLFHSFQRLPYEILHTFYSCSSRHDLDKVCSSWGLCGAETKIYFNNSLFVQVWAVLICHSFTPNKETNCMKISNTAQAIVGTRRPTNWSVINWKEHCMSRISNWNGHAPHKITRNLHRNTTQQIRNHHAFLCFLPNYSAWALFVCRVRRKLPPTMMLF